MKRDFLPAAVFSLFVFSVFVIVWSAFSSSSGNGASVDGNTDVATPVLTQVADEESSVGKSEGFCDTEVHQDSSGVSASTEAERLMTRRLALSGDALFAVLNTVKDIAEKGAPVEVEFFISVDGEVTLNLSTTGAGAK